MLCRYVVTTSEQTCGPAFLRWLATQPSRPNPLEFLATAAGGAIMPRDLENLVEYLNVLGLVDSEGWREQARLPRRVALTARGRDCVKNCDADITTWRTQQP